MKCEVFPYDVGKITGISAEEQRMKRTFLEQQNLALQKQSRQAACVSVTCAWHSRKECERKNVTHRARGCTCGEGTDTSLSIQQSDPSKSMSVLQSSVTGFA